MSDELKKLRSEKEDLERRLNSQLSLWEVREREFVTKREAKMLDEVAKYKELYRQAENDAVDSAQKLTDFKKTIEDRFYVETFKYTSGSGPWRKAMDALDAFRKILKSLEA